MLVETLVFSTYKSAKLSLYVFLTTFCVDVYDMACVRK
jgi:hypothetical protein